MTEAEIAWLAGLFEGEGCLTVDRQRNVWALVIAMTDFDVVRRVHALTGVGRLCEVTRKGPRKPLLRWEIRKRDDIASVARLIRPWLGERRGAKVDDFLAWHATLPSRPVTGVCPDCGSRTEPVGGNVYCVAPLNRCGWASYAA